MSKEQLKAAAKLSKDMVYAEPSFTARLTGESLARALESSDKQNFNRSDVATVISKAIKENGALDGEALTTFVNTHANALHSAALKTPKLGYNPAQAQEGIARGYQSTAGLDEAGGIYDNARLIAQISPASVAAPNLPGSNPVALGHGGDSFAAHHPQEPSAIKVTKSDIQDFLKNGFGCHDMGNDTNLHGAFIAAYMNTIFTGNGPYSQAEVRAAVDKAIKLDAEMGDSIGEDKRAEVADKIFTGSRPHRQYSLAPDDANAENESSSAPSAQEDIYADITAGHATDAGGEYQVLFKTHPNAQAYNKAMFDEVAAGQATGGGEYYAPPPQSVEPVTGGGESTPEDNPGAPATSNTGVVAGDDAVAQVGLTAVHDVSSEYGQLRLKEPTEKDPTVYDDGAPSHTN